MKINFKRKILIALESIVECHEYIKKMSTATDISHYLALCQEVAMSVKNVVETKEDAGYEKDNLLKMLGEYNKNLFLANNIGEINIEFERAFCVCEENIVEIRNSVVEKLPNEKMVAVFLPYNASMWDCFDSICTEAMKNDDWNVFVMPVPYHSLNAQHLPYELNYEYAALPQHLPLVDYRDCSLQELAPDVVFYHNPYDDFNRLTKVFPEFYSRNLLKITPNIVYIPYYVSEQNTMEHMLELPGVKNAWRVVIQEELKEQFLKIYPKEKILLYGNPKFDALFNVNKDEIPQKWKEKISNKTVFFYNTHLTSVMSSQDKFFHMIDYIIETLKTSEDVVILWRPHPLLRQTLLTFSDNAEYMKKYKRLIKQFKSLPNAIYDNSGKLHTSMAISDAYIGTARSSVLKLYKELNKPIYIIPDFFESNYWERNCFRANRGGIVCNNELWQFDSNFNALFKMDMSTFDVEFITTIEKYPFAEKQLYHLVDNYDKWLILLPTKKKEMVIFNIETNEQRKIQLTKEDLFEYHHYLSALNDGILTFALNGSTERYYSFSFKNFELKEYKTNLEGQIIGVEQNYLWLFDADNKQLSAQNVFDDEVIIYSLPANLTFKKLPFIKIDCDDLWIIERDEGVLLYYKYFKDPTNFSIHNVSPNCQKSKDIHIRMCHVHNKKLLLSNTYSDEIYSYYPKTKTLTALVSKSDGSITPHCLTAVSYNECSYIMPFDTNEPYLIEVDKYATKIQKRRFKLRKSEKLVNHLLDDYVNENSCIANLQSFPISLTDFIKAIKEIRKTENDAMRYKYANIGEKVFNHISEELLG